MQLTERQQLGVNLLPVNLTYRQQNSGHPTSFCYLNWFISRNRDDLSKFCRFCKSFGDLFLNKFDFIEILSILSKFSRFLSKLCLFIQILFTVYINFLDFINKKNCWFYKKKFVDFIEILKFCRIKNWIYLNFVDFLKKKLYSYYFKSFSLTQIVYSLCTVQYWIAAY